MPEERRRLKVRDPEKLNWRPRELIAQVGRAGGQGLLCMLLQGCERTRAGGLAVGWVGWCVGELAGVWVCRWVGWRVGGRVGGLPCWCAAPEA